MDVAGIEPAFANSVLSNFVRANHFTPICSTYLQYYPSIASCFRWHYGIAVIPVLLRFSTVHYYFKLWSSFALFASPRSVHCCTRSLTDDLYSITGLVGDNWYVAVLFNIWTSYAFFVPEIYSPCRYDIVTKAPHYFAIDSVRSNSLIHVYPFALNHEVIGSRFGCMAKFGGISPTRKPIKRWWLNFTCGRLLNFVVLICILVFLNVTIILSTLARV